MSDHQVATATLLDALPDKTVLGAPPARVTGLAYDSRKATPVGDKMKSVKIIEVAQ